MDRLDEYDRLYSDVRACKNCHNHELIRPLVPKRFRFCWEPLRVRAAPRGPFSFVFVAMEPFAANCPADPEPGWFNEPLRFAIDRFLFMDSEPRSFLITNMAKCSLPVDTARRTEGFRYEQCASFLASEIRYARTTRLVSIGRGPKRYLERFHDRYGIDAGVQIPWVLHYATLNNRRFSDWAHEHRTAFDAFVTEHSNEYETFLRNEGCSTQADAFLRRPDSDLYRIFRYSKDMSALRTSYGLDSVGR
ncbi:MAG: hypothetical protein ACRD11_05650 [Terriglobia bacterium]